jgi:hypothetical protein
VTEWIKQLMPDSKIQNTIKNIVNTFDPQKTVGIHIRRNDALKGPNKKKILQFSDDSYFEKIIDKFIKQGLTIYLATDEQRVWDAYKLKYENRIIGLDIQRKEYNYTDIKHGQKDALVDLYCLSSCREIVGTFSSNFSFIAKVLRTKVNNPIFDLVQTVETPKPSSTTNYFKKSIKILSVHTYFNSKNESNCLFLLETLNYFEPGISVIIFCDDTNINLQYPNLNIELIIDPRDKKKRTSICLEKHPNTIFIDATMFVVNPLPRIVVEAEVLTNPNRTVTFSKKVEGIEELWEDSFFFYSNTSPNTLYTDLCNPSFNFNRRTRFVENILFTESPDVLQKSLLMNTLKNTYEFEFLFEKLVTMLRQKYEANYKYFFKMNYDILPFDHTTFNLKHQSELSELNAMKTFEKHATKTTYDFRKKHIIVVCDGNIQQLLWNVNLALQLTSLTDFIISVYWNEKILDPSILKKEIPIVPQIQLQTILQYCSYHVVSTDSKLSTLNLNYDSSYIIGSVEETVERLKKDTLNIVYIHEKLEDLDISFDPLN